MARQVPPDKLPRHFDRAVKRALEAAGNRLDSEFTQQISAEKWPWPRDTLRSGNRIAGSPRDIVDFGQLRASQNREKLNPYTLKWTWPVNYSAIVHEGGRFKSGTAYPARPWTKSAVEEVDPENYFADILRRELNG